MKVQVASAQYAGEGWTAPMYAAPQVPADGSFVDLTYVFLFAFNGPQSAQLREPVAANCVIPHYAEHEGDVESVTVRVDPG